MICYSGGADGADSYFDEIGKKYNVETIHFYYGRKTPMGNKEISKEELKEGWQKCLTANECFLHRYGAEKYKNLLARNWFQVKYSDAIFAIGYLLGDTESTNGKVQVSGGTAWATAMSLLDGKTTYIFDQNTNQWFQLFSTGNHDYISCIQLGFIPKLTEKFAGIGSRQLTENGKKAIEQLFEERFNEPDI